MSDERQVRKTDLLQELGEQLPWDRPDRDRREAVRASLLEAAARSRRTSPSRPWWVAGAAFGAGVLAAAALAMILLRPVTRDEAFDVPAQHARIEASPTAQVERSSSATPLGSDELVRVRSGTVRLSIPSLRGGDRVRVQTGDAEVEGTGAYEVEVTHDALAGVRVTKGTARVRVSGQQVVVLASGQTWTTPVVRTELPLVVPSAPSAREAPVVDTPAPAVEPTFDRPAPLSGTRRARPAVPTDAPRLPRPAVAAPVASAPALSAPAPALSAPAPAPAPAPALSAPAPAVTAPATAVTPPATAPAPEQAQPATTATERHLRTGWQLLRANKPAEAAVELAAAADAGEGPLAVDARYFQAVAHARAGHDQLAERALVQFLELAPGSVRRGRAALMLGRLLAKRGDKASARAWLESSLADPDPAVGAAARAALGAL